MKDKNPFFFFFKLISNVYFIHVYRIKTRMILFKKQLFDLEVKGQGSMKVITVCDTLPYGHAPTYQISLTYLKRQKSYGPDKKILFKKTII